MKKQTRFLIHLCLPLGMIFLFSGCMKDKVTKTYTISTPIYEVLSQFRESVRSQDPVAVQSIGKITVAGKYIFLSEVMKGIHVIDNSNPASPKNISFINIPGNEDMAIEGNTLYADAYGDLVSFDISDPTHVVAKNFLANVFPDHSNYFLGNMLPGAKINPDSVNVIVGWSTRDTTVDYNPNQNVFPMFGAPGCGNCAFQAAASTNSSISTVGTNGSLARFSIIGNYLYAVGTSTLSTFNISHPFAPAFSSNVTVDWHVETIYPLKDKLFVGTNNGMYMYDVTASPGNPTLISQFTHVRGCDPVIADDHYAYVTLNDSSACLGISNELQIVDIQDLNNASLVKAYPLSHPIGLSKDGNHLFVCDRQAGLIIYDASNVNNLTVIKLLNDGVFNDVVAENGLAIVVAADGLYQYDYSDLNNIHLVSKL